MLTRALILAVMLGAPPPRDLAMPPARGEGARVVTAPADLSAAPEVLEVASGFVWLVLADGTPSLKATKVPAGVYITAAGQSNLEASIERELAELRAERDALRAERNALRRELARYREAPPRQPPTTTGGEL